MEHARRWRTERVRRGRGVRLRVIQGHKQIVADHLHAAYLHLGEAVRALRGVTSLRGMRRAHREAFDRAGVAVAAASRQLRAIEGDGPGALPRLPSKASLAGWRSPLPVLEKARALDHVEALLDARARLAPLLREEGREGGRPLPDDLEDGPRLERMLAEGAARTALAIVARGSLSPTP